MQSLRMVFLRDVSKKARALVLWVLACSTIGLMVAPSSTETAVANGDTRTLHLYHTHTGETIDATFRVDGRYDPAVLRQLNHFLRDWRNNDEINMDPRLFDAVWEAYGAAGATDRVQIYSAYRSPETNAMLRRRSRAVAEHSQHMLGKAMDTTMPGFPMDRIRDAGMKLQRGGVGWYPSANFVHLDVGGVRSWPRMPYEQLARLFPDGKTVHIPSNGQPLPGYEQARMELAARGATDLPPAQESGGFFAWLFGGGGNSNTVGAAREDEEDRRTAVAVAQPARQRPQAQPAPVRVEPQQAELQQAEPSRVEPVAVAQRDAPQGTPLAYAEQPAPGAIPNVSMARVQGEQVASLEPPQGLDRVRAMVGMPLPPRRPSDLAAIVLDIPMPPVRPDDLIRSQSAGIRFTEAKPIAPRPDPIAGLITATASGVPMLRRSRLPAIITQGDGHKPLPHHAMSFAESVSLFDAVPEPRVARSVLPRAAGLRASTRPVAVLAPPLPPVAPRLTGLRKAAKLMAQRDTL